MSNETSQAQQDEIQKVAELTAQAAETDANEILTERQMLLDKVQEHLLSIGVPEDLILKFLYPGKKDLEHTLSTLQKMHLHLLTKEDWEKFAKMPKNLDTLKKIKLPTLCGWTEDEIKQALTPYILKQAQKYATGRCDLGECAQNGSFGILKAIRTDAGMAPFSCHAYRRIQTSIRRPSAEAGVVRKPEKRPSKDEVRIFLTTYLNGDLQRFLQDKVIKNFLKDKFADEDYGFKIIYNGIGKKKGYNAASRKEKIQINYKISLIMSGLTLSRICALYGKHTVTKKEGPFVKNLSKLIADLPKNLFRQHNFTFSRDNYLSSWDLEDKEVQRTGRKGVKEKMVRMSWDFDSPIMTIDENNNMVECLAWKYWSPYIGYPHVEDFKYALSMCHTVNELVSIIACPPDFHGNPDSLDAGRIGDEEGDNYAIAQNKLVLTRASAKNEDGEKQPAVRERTEEDPSKIGEASNWYQFIRDLMTRIKSQVRAECTKNQKAVFDAQYGEDDSITGTNLANNFGKFTGGGKKKVSRQRIAQYLAAINKKFINAMFEDIINKSGYQRVINMARLGAKLNEEEDAVIVYLLGMDGNNIYEVEELAEDYEHLTRCQMPDECQVIDEKTQKEKREAHTRNVYQTAKKKLMRVLYVE